jgi:hypothetical protein
MDDGKYRFLKAILGEDGAAALVKAADRAPELEAVILPRALMAWLEIRTLEDYEGPIPGQLNSYVQFQKSEDRFTGSIAIGDNVYGFESATLLHLGACIAVVLGADRDMVHADLRDRDLQRLGKNIDLLVRARTVVSELRKGEPLEKAIKDLQPGKKISEAKWDYSHLLPAAAHQAGYRLHVKHAPGASTFWADLRFGHAKPGAFSIGDMKANHEDGALNIEDSEIADPGHHGKGLGQAMYEAMMTHGYHTLGLRNIRGGPTHSTSASRVHQKLSEKHGLGYKPTATKFPSLAGPRGEPYDNRMGEYRYALKAEMRPGKGGKEAPGPAAAPLEPEQPLAPQPPDPNQNSKGPVVSLRPQAVKIPQPKTTQEVVQTGKGAVQKHPKKVPTLRVTKSQAEAECNACGGRQFKGDRFTGCFCFRDLAKSVKVESLKDGYNLVFDGWETDDFLAFMDALEDG